MSRNLIHMQTLYLPLYLIHRIREREKKYEERNEETKNPWLN